MNQTSAISILCDATITASLMILDSKGYDRKQVNAEKLSVDLKTTIKAEIGTILREWQEAVESNLGEGWLREVMNTQANWLAVKALKAGGWF